jgi:hypothetical protein
MEAEIDCKLQSNSSWTQNAKRHFGKIACGIVMLVLGVCFLSGALSALLYHTTIYFERWMYPWQAIIGGGLSCALGLFLVIHGFRRKKKRRPFVVALMWALISSIIAFSIAPIFSDTDLRKVIYAGAATLLFGGLLGGVLKVLLDEVVAARRRREDAAGFVVNVLTDLKGVYDRVARSQTLIPAHKSVKTYGNEMRDMIEAQVQLRNVTRALDGREEGIDETMRADVTNLVKEMERYLDQLAVEFRENYKTLSDTQRGYEERANVMVKRYAKAKSRKSPPVLPTFVWDRLSSLPMLADFISKGDVYETGFEKPARRSQ